MSISKKKLYERYLSRVEPLLSSPLHAEMADALFKGKTKVLRLSRYESSAFDTSWVDVIEDVLYDLGEIIKAPRTITKEVGSLTPIELAKKVNSESIQHLSSHTQYVKNIDEDGNVIPSKVMSFSNDDFLFTYENRFIATFIRRLVLFVEKRYEFIQAYIPLHKEEVLMVKTTATIDGEEVEIETRIKSKAECSDPAAQSAAIVAARIRRMREYILYYYSSPFMKKMKNERDVRKPILMTNILRKNVRYHKCYECFTFLERYESLGLNYKSDDTYHSFSEEQLKEMALLNLGQFLALQDGTEYETIKTRPHAYKPRIMTSIDDEEFLFGPLPKGPIEFVRVDEEYRKYLEARAARELPERPKKAEKEYYENEYGDRREARSELKEIDKLLRRKQAAIKRFEKDLEAIIALREYEDNLLLQWEYQERLDTEELRLNQKRAEIAADALGYHPEEATLDELLARAKEEVEEGGHRDYYVNPDEEELAFRAEHGDLGDTWKNEQGYASSDQPYFGTGNEGQPIYTVGQGEGGAATEGEEVAEPSEEDLERLDQAAFQEEVESASNVPMEGEAASQSKTAADNVAAEGVATEEGASITQGQEASTQEGAAEASQEGVAERSAQEGQPAGAEGAATQEGVVAEDAATGAEGATAEEAGAASEAAEGTATAEEAGAASEAIEGATTAEGAATLAAEGTEGQASTSEAAEGAVATEGTSTEQQVVVSQEGETVLLAEGGESTEASAEGQSAILSPLGVAGAEQASHAIAEGAGMVIAPDGSLSEESASFASENAEENQNEATPAGKKPFIVVKGTGGDRDYSPVYDRPVEEIVMDEMLGLEVAAPKKRPIKKNKPKKAEPVKEEAPAPMVPVEESILEEMLAMPMEEPASFATSYESKAAIEPEPTEEATEEAVTEPENAFEPFEAAEPENEEAVSEETEASEESLTQEEPAEEMAPEQEEEPSEEDEDALNDLAALDGASEEEMNEAFDQEEPSIEPEEVAEAMQEQAGPEVPAESTQELDHDFDASLEMKERLIEEPTEEDAPQETEEAEPDAEEETLVEEETEEPLPENAEESVEETPAEEPIEEEPAEEVMSQEAKEAEPAPEEDLDEAETKEPSPEGAEESVEETPAEESIEEAPAEEVSKEPADDAPENALEETPEEASSALNEGEEPSEEKRNEENLEEPSQEERVEEEPKGEDYDIFIEEEEESPAEPEIPAEPTPKYATPGYVAPSRGLASIPGAFVVKTPEGYYVAEGVFAKGKNKAKVFTDFNQANNAKKRFGGKVVKL